MIKKKLLAWLKLSRVPFLIPGLAPFLAGVVYGLSKGFNLDIMLFTIAISGLTLILLATYYSNEYFDYEGDLINRGFNRFSGGSRVLPSSLLPRRYALYALSSSLFTFIALSLTLYLLDYFKSFPLLFLFAVVGIFVGLSYSTPPIKLAYRGIGETVIGFCYGWLTFNSGYYIVSGRIELATTILSLPIAFSIFSVILINEFPDLEADKAVGKKNLVVRLGLRRASKLYIFAILASYLSALTCVAFGGPKSLLLTSLPILILVIALVYKMIKEEYRAPKELEKICALTIVLNALYSLSIIASSMMQS